MFFSRFIERKRPIRNFTECFVILLASIQSPKRIRGSATQNIYLLPRSLYKRSRKESLIGIPSCMSSRPFSVSPWKTYNSCKYPCLVDLSASDTPISAIIDNVQFHLIFYNLRYTRRTCTLYHGVRFSRGPQKENAGIVLKREAIEKNYVKR